MTDKCRSCGLDDTWPHSCFRSMQNRMNTVDQHVESIYAALGVNPGSDAPERIRVLVLAELVSRGVAQENLRLRTELAEAKALWHERSGTVRLHEIRIRSLEGAIRTIRDGHKGNSLEQFCINALAFAGSELETSAHKPTACETAVSSGFSDITRGYFVKMDNGGDANGR